MKWEARVHGISSHAGMHPEHGASAILMASRAISQVSQKGYFGLIRKGTKTGTANAGIISGGEATNQVTDAVTVQGECRSHNPAFLKEIMKAWRQAFSDAARSVKNHKGVCGRVEFLPRNDYAAFRLPDAHPAVTFTMETAAAMGFRPRTVAMNGGLDANPLNAHGIPTITLGAGQHGAHSIEEHVVMREYLDGCRLALALVTRPME